MFEEYKKKIHAYLKKCTNNAPIDFQLAENYFNKYSEEEFDNLITKHFDIKTVTVENILKAKKLTPNKILTEYEEQKTYVKWLRDRKIKCQVANNNSDSIYSAARNKALGMSKGFPDLQVFLGMGKILFIEMKRIKGSHTYPEQIKWNEWLNNNGYKAYICYGADDAIEKTKKEQANEN